MNLILRNSLWMMIEKLVSIFGLIFITSYVAKYIGPDNFGKMSFAISVFAIVQIIAMLGMDNILFKKISKNQLNGEKLMLITKKIRFYIYFLLSALVLLYLYFILDFITFIFCFASCLSGIFVVQDVLAIYNNASLNSKINTIFNVIGLVISLFLRYVIVKTDANLLYLSVPLITISAIPYLLRKSYYGRKRIKHIHQIIRDEKNKFYMRFVLITGLPIAISSVATTIYSRISQIFLYAFSSETDVGLFSVASTLASSWTFITLSLITSYYVIIFKEQNLINAIKLTSKLNFISLFIALVITMITGFLGKFIIDILYGKEYSQSYSLLLILLVSSIFSALGPISYRFIIKLDGYRYLALKTIIVAIFGIILSYLLIKLYGVEGAAYSILIIEILSLTFFNYFFKKGIIFKIHFYYLMHFFYILRFK